MTCADVADRIVDRLYGELAETDQRAFEQHLAGCEGCRRELEGFERTRRTARTALMGPLHEPAPARVRAEVLQAAERAARQRVLEAPKAGAIPVPAESTGFWAWLRRPWFLPAFATVSILALFFIARPVLMDGPKRVLDESLSAPVPPAVMAPPAPETDSPEDEPTDQKAVYATPPSAATSPAKEKREEGSGNRTAALRARARSGKGGPVAKKVSSDLPFKAHEPNSRQVAGGVGAGRAGEQSVASLDSAPKLYAPPPPQAEPTRLEVKNQPQKPRVSADDLTLRLSDSEAKARPARPQAFAPGPPIVTRELYRSAAPPPAPSAASTAAEPAARAPASPPPRAIPAGAPLEPEAVAAPAARSELQANEAPARRARIDQQLSLEALIEKADRLFDEGKWQPALEAYRELLRRFPQHSRARDWRRRTDTATRSQAR